jgi:hypothetical protein
MSTSPPMLSKKIVRKSEFALVEARNVIRLGRASSVIWFEK